MERLSRIPLRYKAIFLLYVATLLSILGFLLYVLFFYTGPYSGILSTAASYTSSYVIYKIYDLRRTILRPFKLVKMDIERHDRRKTVQFRERYGLVTYCYDIAIPEYEEVNMKLKKAESVKCEFIDNTYIPHDLIEMVEPFREDLKAVAKEEGIATRYYMKARAISRDSKSIKMERVPYLYSYIFHFSPGLKVGKKRLYEILRPLVYDEGLIELKDSRFPNHLGVRCIAETADGYLILSVRGIELAIDKGLYSISCEGAVGAPRNPRKTTLKDIIQQQVSHELVLSKDEYEAYVLSYSRDMSMMGKPNVYVYLKLKLTSDELKDRLKDVGEDLKFVFVKPDEAKKFLKSATHTLIYGLRLYENRVR